MQQQPTTNTSETKGRVNYSKILVCKLTALHRFIHVSTINGVTKNEKQIQQDKWSKHLAQERTQNTN